MPKTTFFQNKFVIEIEKTFFRILFYLTMVAYFCHHLSDNYVDLSDNYVDLSDHYVDLSENYHQVDIIF